MTGVGTRSPAPRLRSLALAALLAAGGCGGESPPGPDIVARVGAAEIPYREFELYLEENSVEADGALDSRVLSRLLDQFLDETALRELAVDQGVAAAGGSRGDAARALLREVRGRPVDAERVADFYRRHQDRYRRPERVRLRQILVEDRATAERAIAELRSGVPFDEVARTLSLDPAAPRGGDQGLLGREDLPPAFADAIFALEPGEVSAIVPADYGFHIFQVTERQPAGAEPLARVEPEVRELLRRQEAEEALARLVDEARDRYNVRLYRRNLPFDYEGAYDSDP